MSSEIKNLHYPYRWRNNIGQEEVYMRQMHSSDILKLFHVGGKNGNGPIPADFYASKWIGDVLVEVRTKAHAAESQINRRVVAMCNECGKWVCAGHLFQHQKIHRKSKEV